jgi:hypothetical protein
MVIGGHLISKLEKIEICQKLPLGEQLIVTPLTTVDAGQWSGDLSLQSSQINASEDTSSPLILAV